MFHVSLFSAEKAYPFFQIPSYPLHSPPPPIKLIQYGG
jgi:hypothetical protein